MKNFGISLLSTVAAISTLASAAPCAESLPFDNPDPLCPRNSELKSPTFEEITQCLDDKTKCPGYVPPSGEEPQQDPEVGPPAQTCWRGFGGVDFPPTLEYDPPMCGPSGVCKKITELALTSALYSARADPGAVAELYSDAECTTGRRIVDDEGWGDLTKAQPYTYFMMK